MKSFLVALQFLTIFPVRIRTEMEGRDFGASLLYFPIIGTLLGLLLAAVLYLSSFLPVLVGSSLVLVSSVVMTGGIHLDGFADTCDGFYGKRSKEEILRIMRDPRVGVMAVIGTTLLLLFKFTLIAGIPREFLWRSLILAPAFARWCQVLACRTSTYAREEGKAGYFMEYAGKKEFLIGGLFAIILFLSLTGFEGLVLFVLSLFSVLLFIRYVKGKIGGMTGDTIGAVSEIAEVFVLLFSLVCLPLSAEAAECPKRIISLNPSLTESLCSLGLGKNLIAVTSYCNYPEEARKKEIIGDLLNPNVEKIFSLSPDLVVASNGINRPQTIEKLKELGLAVAVFGEGDDFDDIAENFIRLGRITGAEKRAREIAETARSEVESIERKLAALPRVRVFWEMGSKPLVAAGGAASFVNEFIRRSGGINVFDDVPARYFCVSREEVLRRDPQVIILTTMGCVTGAEKTYWLAFGDLKAALSGRVYVIDADKVSRPTPERFLAGLRETARFLHPEVFEKGERS